MCNGQDVGLYYKPFSAGALGPVASPMTKDSILARDYNQDRESNDRGLLYLTLAVLHMRGRRGSTITQLHKSNATQLKPTINA